jgi:molybdopterin/thiamine biosynthesis adenylyltransferase
MRASNVLICGVGALGAEIAKNIVLAGIGNFSCSFLSIFFPHFHVVLPPGSLTILDSNNVTERFSSLSFLVSLVRPCHSIVYDCSDLAGQFFVRKSDMGKNVCLAFFLSVSFKCCSLRQRASSSADRISELNPNVKITSDTSGLIVLLVLGLLGPGLSLLSSLLLFLLLTPLSDPLKKQADFYAGFDIVCVTDFPLATQVSPSFS